MTRGFDGWHGADVVVATGWETVYPVLRLPGCHARVYLVHDHEPDFFAVSAESPVGGATPTRHGLYPISGSRLAAGPARTSATDAHGSWYRFGVDARRLPAGSRQRRDQRHGRCSTARAGHSPARGAAWPVGARGAGGGAGPTTRVVLVRTGPSRCARTAFGYEHARRGAAGHAGAPRTRARTIGLCAVADQLLPDPTGDDGLRPAVGGRRSAAARRRSSDATAGLSSRLPTPWPSPTRWGHSSTIRTLWRRRSEAGLALRRRHQLGGRHPPSRGRAA